MVHDDFVEMESEDGHHYVHKGDLGPFYHDPLVSNRRECYNCGSRRHWTMDCPRKDLPSQQSPEPK